MDNRVAALAITSITNVISNYTNMLHKCPYIGYHYLKDFPVSSEMAHPAMPVGDYRSDIRFYNGKNQTILFAKLYMTFKPRGTQYQVNG